MMTAYQDSDASMTTIGLDGEQIIVRRKNVMGRLPAVWVNAAKAKGIVITTRIVFQGLNASMIGRGIYSRKTIIAQRNFGTGNVTNFPNGYKNPIE